MRTRWIRTAKDGVTAISGIRDLNKEPLPDSTENMLAAASLMSLTIKHIDGSKIEYMALEYECRGCGSYDHRDMSCICETCGNPWDDHPVDQRLDRHCPWTEIAP